MDSVNKTLYIPLYGKSYVSKKGIILKDKKAEEIWEREQFKLKGKSKSKNLALQKTLLRWCKDKLQTGMIFANSVSVKGLILRLFTELSNHSQQ